MKENDLDLQAHSLSFFFSFFRVVSSQGSGCYIPKISGGTGSLSITNCAAYETGNQGCGIIDDSGSANYGVNFNNNGGGVYASSSSSRCLHFFFSFFPRV